MGAIGSARNRRRTDSFERGARQRFILTLTKGSNMIMILICFLAPWLAMFLRGHVWQGLLCIVLHLTLIGWIPATNWALIVTRREA